MAFKYISGPKYTRKIGVLGSATMVKGGTCRFDAGTGFLEPSVEGAVTHYGICDEGVVANSTSGVTEVIMTPFLPGQIWEVDTTGDMAQTYVGTICALESATAIDEDETSTRPVFKIVGMVGETTDRKALVEPYLTLMTSVGV